MTGGVFVAGGWTILLLAFLWVTNPEHKRTRRVLGPVVRGLLGAAIRLHLSR